MYIKLYANTVDRVLKIQLGAWNLTFLYTQMLSLFCFKNAGFHCIDNFVGLDAYSTCLGYIVKMADT